jgi:predicted transcriptional regulator
MAVNEVYQLLKSKGDWMSSKEISKELNVSQRNIMKSLARLEKYESIEQKTRARRLGGNLWKARKEVREEI